MFCTNCGNKVTETSSFCNQCGTQVTNDGNQIMLKQETVKEKVTDHQSEVRMDEKTVVSRNAKNRKKALIWLVAPWVLLIGTMFFYAIMQFVVSSIAPATDTAAIGLGTEDVSMTISKIIRAFVGLIGIVAVMGIIIGIPLGIMYLSKKEEYVGMKYDGRSGKGQDSTIPEEIRSWNWGAAGLTFIWGISHSVWISLLMFVPIVNYILWIWLGIKGNELAWRANKWESVDSFLETQRKWKPWGIFFFIMGILLSLLSGLAGEL